MKLHTFPRDLVICSAFPLAAKACISAWVGGSLKVPGKGAMPTGFCAVPAMAVAVASAASVEVTFAPFHVSFSSGARPLSRR